MLKYRYKGVEEENAKRLPFRETAVGVSRVGRACAVVAFEPRGRKFVRVEPLRDYCVNV